MRLMISCVLMMVATCAAVAGPLSLRNESAASRHKTAEAVAKSSQASVTDAQLLALWQAAKNQADKDAVILKLLQRNAGVTAILEEQVKASKKSK